MNKKTVIALVTILFMFLFTVFSSQFLSVISNIKRFGFNLASIIISHNFKTISEIKSNYNNNRDDVRILIVPGHEPNYGGSEYSNLKERDMVVELAQALKGFIQENNNYKVYTTRDTGDWSNEFSEYYKDNWDDILEWKKASRDDHSANVIIDKSVLSKSKVRHNYAAPDVAARLYGITKWANENDIDIVLHVHFNDNVRRNTSVPGVYSGITIYVPDRQFGNSLTTKAIAKNILERLKKYNPVSNLPVESEGIVDDPELIAVGSNNTSNAASLLIEYGYIYEQQFQNPEMRSLAIRDLAYQTYLGLQDFFGKNKSIALTKIYDTTILPYEFNLVQSELSMVDVFALQTALIFDNVYPPRGSSKNDCPRNGKIGPCTQRAIEEFQRKYEILGESGKVGPKTIEMLNRI